jgi:hypothetical protein
MTSQGRGKRNKASEVGAIPIQSHFQAMSLMIGCKPNASSTVTGRKKAS